jgi:hypothetical protein
MDLTSDVVCGRDLGVMAVPVNGDFSDGFWHGGCHLL